MLFCFGRTFITAAHCSIEIDGTSAEDRHLDTDPAYVVYGGMYNRCGQQVNINVFQLDIDGCKVDSMMIRKQEPSWQSSRIRSFVRHPQFWNGSSNWSPNMGKTF